MSDEKRGRQARRWFILGVVGLLGVGLWVFFPPGRVEAPPESGDYTWAHPLHYSPAAARLGRTRREGDRLGRFLDRLDWGNSDVQNWTVRHLEREGATVGDRIADRLAENLARNPLYAKKLLDVLSLVARDGHLDAVEPALFHSYDFVRIAAVKVVGAIDSERAFERLAELTRSTDPAVQAPAFDLFFKRAGLHDAVSLTAYLQGQADLRETTDGSIDPGLGQAMRVAGRAGVESATGSLKRLLKSSVPGVRDEAARALLALGDPDGDGFAHFRPWLDADAETTQKALSILGDVGFLPPTTLLGRLTDSPIAATRLVATKLAVAALPPEGDPRRADVLGLLERRLDDTDLSIVHEAAQGLYRAGHIEIALEWLDRLKTATGGELRDAVQIVTEGFTDPRGAAVLVDRLGDDSLSAVDRSQILHGVSVYHEPAALGEFLEDIARAGTTEDPRLQTTTLAFHAAMKIQALGIVAVDGLFDLLVPGVRPAVDRLVLDALRGVVADIPTGALRERGLDRIVSVAEDRTREPDVRRGAVETLVFFDDLSLDSRLLDLKRRLRDPDVIAVVEGLLWNYF